MSRSELVLTQGARVAIVGGGPAGSFCALYLHRYAQEVGLPLDITIYEPKSFQFRGAKGCNHCAGVLSASLVKNLADLNLELPGSVVQNRIDTYILHSPHGDVPIPSPGPGDAVWSIFRGGGPLHSDLKMPVSFDAFLLEEARAKGARVLPERVREISLASRAPVVVSGEARDYDLVVLACGVNSLSPSGHDWLYLPPQRQGMAVDELYVGADAVQATLKNSVHIFVFPGTDVVFGSLVPKGPFVNVSILSRGKPPTVDEFLAHDLVKKTLSFPYERACGCRPFIGVSPARYPFADGFVAVGDACVSRLYKDGIGSALLTARCAARTAIHHGISGQDFRKHYLPLCRSIARDNLYGRLLFSFHQRAKDSRFFLRVQANLIAAEAASPGSREIVSKATWGMFTGSYSYRRITTRVLSPSVIGRFVLAALRVALRSVAQAWLQRG